jgi:hypothetical protein
MPIALLLQETVYTFRWGAFHLEPWSRLVRTEELLIDRARSAFLVRWFGKELPLNSFFVAVAIANIGDLRERYFAVSAAIAPEATGPNLTTPLAGLVGEIAGIALSPTSAVLAIAVMLRNIPYWAHVLVGALGWKVALLPLEPLVVPVLGPVLLPLGLFGGIALAIQNPVELRAVYDMLGAAARLIIAAVDFLKLITGPREEIGNPLLRRVLSLLDALAGLFPYVLAFVAIVVTRIGPLIEPLVAQATALKALIDEVVATVKFIFDDISATVKRQLPAIYDVVDFVLVQLEIFLPVLQIAFTQLFTDLAEMIGDLISKTSSKIKDWFAKARIAITDIVLSQPLSIKIKSALISFEVAARALSSGASSPKSSTSALPADFPELKLTKPEDFLRSMGGAPPGGLGAIGVLARIDIKYGGALFEDYLPFSAAARRAVAQARHPRSVFAMERQRLVSELGEPPALALAKLRADQLQLRDLLTTVVGRVLPPSMRVYLGSVLDTLRQLDMNLFQVKVAKSDYPVRDLPDNGLLKPVIHRLTIRAPNGRKSDIDDFRIKLQGMLGKQSYPAVAEG